LLVWLSNRDRQLQQPPWLSLDGVWRSNVSGSG
jgi:hypothetical protein